MSVAIENCHSWPQNINRHMKLPFLTTICFWYLHVFSMHWYFLISSYYLTVSNGCSFTASKSIEVTQCSGSFNGGVHQFYPGKSENLSSFQDFLISSYYLTVSNGRSLTTFKSVEFTQCSGSFNGGVGSSVLPG